MATTAVGRHDGGSWTRPHRPRRRAVPGPDPPPAATTRGSLRVYLGVASGVGTTYAMLSEGRRRRARGTDVVVACVDTHGRPATGALLAGVPTVAGDATEGMAGGDLDVDAVLARKPAVALVDDLARANA